MMRLASTLTLLLGLACTAYAQSPRQAAEPVQSQAYEQTVPYRSLRGTSPQACAADCAADKLCRAWTLTPPTFSRAPRCELRTTPAYTQTHPAAVTGVIPRENSPQELSDAPQSSETMPRQTTTQPALAGGGAPAAVDSQTRLEPAAQRRVQTGAVTQSEENIPFSERRITVESYPTGYEPETVSAVPETAPSSKPRPVRTEPVTTAREPREPAPATPRPEAHINTETKIATPSVKKPVESVAAPEPTPMPSGTEASSPEQAAPRSMVTTRADLSRTPAEPRTTAVEPRPTTEPASSPVRTEASAPSQASKPTRSQARPSTATPDKPSGPWPGLRNASPASEAAPVERDRPLPGLRRNGARTYSVQDMESLPGDYEDNAGLQGRLPAGQIDEPEENDDENEEDEADEEIGS